MSDHPIRLSLIGNRVHAEPNPLSIQQPVGPGDTVIWSFDETVGDRELQVVFQALLDLPPSPGSQLKPGNPMGPFESLSLELAQRRVVGTFRQDLVSIGQITRFFYKFMKDGTLLDLDNPVTFRAGNGGGIDIPGKPPGM